METSQSDGFITNQTALVSAIKAHEILVLIGNEGSGHPVQLGQRSLRWPCVNGGNEGLPLPIHLRKAILPGWDNFS